MKRAIVDAEEWKKARIELLEEEKTLSKAVAALAEKRRQLAWTPLKENYVLKNSSGEDVNLADLFADDSSELIVYHLYGSRATAMYGETYENACSMCCFFVDQFNGVKEHLDPRAKLVLVANKEPEALAELKFKKNWKLQVLSAKGTTFNAELGVSFSGEEVSAGECTYNFNRKWNYGPEAPGLSVFRRVDGVVYRTYSTYAAGLGNLSLVHSLLDITTVGRNEAGKHPMWWVKHKEDYESSLKEENSISSASSKKQKSCS